MQFSFQEWLIVVMFFTLFLKDYISIIFKKWFGVEVKVQESTFETEVKGTLRALAERLTAHLDDEDAKNLEYNKTIREIYERLGGIEQNLK